MTSVTSLPLPLRRLAALWAADTRCALVPGLGLHLEIGIPDLSNVRVPGLGLLIEIGNSRSE